MYTTYVCVFFYVCMYVLQFKMNKYVQYISFFQGGYYAGSFGNLTILVLNTNLYYESNYLTESMPDPANQFQWLDDKLREAEQKNKKVCL